LPMAQATAPSGSEHAFCLQTTFFKRSPSHGKYQQRHALLVPSHGPSSAVLFYSEVPVRERLAAAGIQNEQLRTLVHNYSALMDRLQRAFTQRVFTGRDRKMWVQLAYSDIRPVLTSGSVDLLLTPLSGEASSGDARVYVLRMPGSEDPQARAAPNGTERLRQWELYQWVLSHIYPSNEVAVHHDDQVRKHARLLR
jgi:hypothetical protein